MPCFYTPDTSLRGVLQSYCGDVVPPVRLHEEEPEARCLLPYKHDIITLLGVGGHWVTTEQNLQVDCSQVFHPFVLD